jgi:superfamily II DNA or RNA helicase
MDKPTLVGDIVAHYVRHARGKLGLTFAVSRAHSEHLAEQYRAAGVKAEHLDGETDKAVRAKMVAAYRRREIEMFCNVNLFSAGFDVPGVEVIVDAAPTQSLAMYMQRAGRGSRPEEKIGKTHCILLDHSGNVFRHGLPDMDREWSLDGTAKRKKKKGEEPSVAVRQCDKCYAVFAPAKICPACGAPQIIISREIEHVDGDLQEITPEMVEAMRRDKSREVGRAKTLSALEAIAAERGYSPQWAAHVFQSRERAAQRRVSAQYEAFAR